jgi:hypothetical protein
MESIYSIKILQRILDHWGIGQIEDVMYFNGPGKNIWRHNIDTSQGEFELYSYPASEEDSNYQQKLREFVSERLNWDPQVLKQRKKIHSFDRYHVLAQKTKKHQISLKQAAKDLDLLIGLSIKEAFRVYGTILQMHLNTADDHEAGVLVSYGWWKIQDTKMNQAKVIVDSRIHEYDQLDNAVELVEKNTPTIEKYRLKNSCFEMYLSNQMSLHFVKCRKFSAIEVHFNSRKNDLLIFEEDKLYYVRE